MSQFKRIPPNDLFSLSPIKAIELRAAQIPGAISLAQGIPSFNTPEIIREFIKEKIDLGACDKYSLTNGLSELREEISVSLSKEGLNYDPQTEVIVTAGSIEGITASLLALTEPGDEIIIPSPTYTSYQNAIRVARCVPIFAELDEDNNFDFHVETIKEKITRKTKAIFYCSPNNPTGTLFSESKVLELAKLAEQHDLLLITDEVYKDFYYTDDRHFTPALVPGCRGRVVRVCSFSKAFAMTGWRIGFVHADQKLAERILKYHDTLVTCAPVASQFGAIAALRFGDPLIKQFRDEFKSRRDYTIRILDEMSHIVDYQLPKATYFVFPRIKDSVPLSRDSNKLAYDILEKAHVALVPGIAFGPSGESHLRITFGRSESDLKEGLSRLSDYFSKTRKSRSSNALRTTPSAPKGIAKNLLKLSLRVASQVFLRRTRPTVIGIAGAQGKTVFKRFLSDQLSRVSSTRTGILSYNTDIGLPLSILDLKLPMNLLELILFPLALIERALLRRVDTKYLIVEYGIFSPSDGEELAKVVVPDWLILTGTEIGDPELNLMDLDKGVFNLAKNIPSHRILWSKANWGEDLNKHLTEDCMYLPVSSSDTLDLRGEPVRLRREIVGRSSELALGATLKLANLLNIPPDKIREIL